MLFYVQVPFLTSHLPLSKGIETGEGCRAAAWLSLIIIIIRHFSYVTHSSVKLSRLCLFITIVQLVVSDHWSVHFILSWKVNLSEEFHVFHRSHSLTW